MAAGRTSDFATLRAEENAQAQADELEALGVIYGAELTRRSDTEFIVLLKFPEWRDPLEVTVRFHRRYPSEFAPSVHIYAFWLSEADAYRYEQILRSQFVAGEVVVYSWLSWLENALSGVVEESLSAESQCEETVPYQYVPPTEIDWSAEASLQESLGIYSGVPVTDRRSTFQAHVASVHSREEAQKVRSSLLSDKKIAKALHNITAYRIEDPESHVIFQDNDDDGENAAGGRLAYLLEMTDAINVVVVVSRWFGGVLLGPDRFKHINNVARELLEERGFSRRRR